jgi:hypothetical protein
VPRTIRPSDLPLAVIHLRRAGELIATPCGCGHASCTLGEHVLRAAGHMGPGPRAANIDPTTRGARWEADETGNIWPVPNDPTGEAALQPDAPDVQTLLRQAIITSERAALAVIDLIGAHRPDRRPLDVDEPDGWCSHHLDEIGVCEPRHRGELCRSCYDFARLHGIAPPRRLLQMHRDGRRWTDQDIAIALREHRAAQARPKRKGRRAS